MKARIDELTEIVHEITKFRDGQLTLNSQLFAAISALSDRIKELSAKEEILTERIEALEQQP